MTKRKRFSLADRVQVSIESFLMSRLVPKNRPGLIFSSLFKLPLLFRRLGLNFLIPPTVLILTTRGRHSGKLHHTPVEFSPGPQPGVYTVMSGWEGKTDWYRNARADPRVRVWLDGNEWDALAQPVPEIEVARGLQKVTEMAPAMARVVARWGGVEIDGSEACFQTAAAHFPSLYLHPVDGCQVATN